MLKIKLLSLAQEGRDIRRHEQRRPSRLRRAEARLREMQNYWIAHRQYACIDDVPLFRVEYKAVKTYVKALRAQLRPSGIKGLLRAHRIHVVRPEARHTLLAYAFLRGRTYEQVEAKAEVKPNWNRVRTLVEHYGVQRDWATDTAAAFDVKRKEQEARLSAFAPVGALPTPVAPAPSTTAGKDETPKG